jgi:DNA replication protein
VEGALKMSKVSWFNETYFNQQAWLLEHVHSLQLSSDETLVLLLIQHFQSFQRSIDLNGLAKHANLSVKAIDNVLSQLVKRGYIKINMLQTSLSFDLSPLYTDKPPEMKGDLTQVVLTFEQEFKRPLSAHEVDKIKDWLSKVEADYLTHALREAIIYGKLNFGYIDKILLAWITQNISLEKLNSGQKNG